MPLVYLAMFCISQVRIDHTRHCLMFGTDLNASPLYVEDDFFETKRLQALPSEQMSERFNLMAKALMEASQKLKVDDAEKVNYMSLTDCRYVHLV